MAKTADQVNPLQLEIKDKKKKNIYELGFSPFIHIFFSHIIRDKDIKVTFSGSYI